MGNERSTTKRRRSADDRAILCPRKKLRKAKARQAAIPTTTTTKTKKPPNCPLIKLLRQYGLLESVTSCLTPSELLSLALCCKATYNAMFPHLASLDNLLSKMRCSGNGISIRQRVHAKSSYFYAYPCTEFAQCSTVSRRGIQRPCVSCKVTTCDECRIHCVYQSIYQEPGCFEELPNFSGFVLLEPFEVAILSPHHLPAESDSTPAWQNPANDSTVGPYHDQGFLDMPLELDHPATPEKLSDVLNLDLGVVSLSTWSSSSQFGFPSPVLSPLCDVAEKRKLPLCNSCFENAHKGYKSLTPALPHLPWLVDQIDEDTKAQKECHCSLRSRILDRWQCLKCYVREDATIDTIDIRNMTNASKCWCGMKTKREICLWCWGEILEAKNESA